MDSANVPGRSLPDSRNTPLCRATRLSVSTFFHVKPLAAR